MCEMPQVFGDTERKARKQHNCCECADPIKVGELHYYCQGRWDGRWDSFRQHLKCHKVWSKVQTK